MPTVPSSSVLSASVLTVCLSPVLVVAVSGASAEVCALRMTCGLEEEEAMPGRSLFALGCFRLSGICCEVLNDC